MNIELMQLLLEAGEWAKALTLDRAVWNKDTRCLSICLRSDIEISRQQKEDLSALVAERFSQCDVNIEIKRNGPAVKKTPSVKAETARQPANAKLPAPNGRAAGDQAYDGEKILLGKRIARAEVKLMKDLRDDSGRVTVEGRLVGVELRKLSKDSDRSLLLLNLTDYTNTMQCKAYVGVKQGQQLERNLLHIQNESGFLRIRGDCKYDRFAADLAIQISDIVSIQGKERMDNRENKRIELHLHTKMSAMDALTDVEEAIATAARWGHSAIAVTDHGGVQAFPDAYKAGRKHKVKVIFGVEGYLKPDTSTLPIEQTYVVFDIETTGLKAEQGHILEIGAVKVKNSEIVGRFSTLINAGVAIPQNIVELTGISDDMLRGQPLTRDALQAFADFAQNSVLVAHNASFDVGFIRMHGGRYGISFDQAYADTLMLSRYLLFGLKNYKLNTICKHLGVALASHHRAVDDAEATAQVFIRLLGDMRDLGVYDIPVFSIHEKNLEQGKHAKLHHVILLAQTQAGMKNLYRLVSHAHIDFFHSKPQIPKSLLRFFRKGLLVGSACEQGELFQALLQNRPEDEVKEIACFYDYLEVQPIANNAFLVREGTVKEEEDLRDFNRRIVKLGEELDKPVVATGDVHFLSPEDEAFRAILMHEMGYKDAEMQAPLYFKTTDEMLAEFAYLNEEKAQEVVVNAPHAISALCEELKPYPDGTFAPRIENAEQLLQEMALSSAHARYGQELPGVVVKRLNKELHSIIDNGFASLYLMAQRLVQKSMQDGYLVGSRGSVGSSFVATMAGITEVNPLPPHYVCPQCRHSDFDVDRSQYACGVDMPDKPCPCCGAQYCKEGFDIPFEVFLGFHGDKTPDIDLNFSGEYQAVAHRFTEEMFGEGHAFRAGTISGIKKKTAYGYVMKYMEEHGRTASRLEIDRLCDGCTGVKRTTGQHPGGIVIVPRENDILEFTPIQYPADQKQKNTITTHFDFHALDDRLVKLDILGHDDPTALKMLQDLTGVDPQGIPLGDPDTLSLYTSGDKLHIDLTELGGCQVGSLGIPEFGTGFVRQMLMDTRPTTMEELVRIAGLSHGTDVWLNNAQTLVRDGVATLSQVICTRDDIMNYLITCGCDPSISFKTMENVRKGKGITEDMRQEMLAHGVPDWFIASCEKIKYMFPRAHAVAYVMMSFRVAYYKMHYPEAFYAVYFTVRADAFDVRFALGGAAVVLKNIRSIEKKGKDASNQEIELLTILEVVYEMNLRGIALLPVDIYKSHATKFLIEANGIRAPFSAVAGIGETAAISIAQNTAGEQYVSVEDFQSKTSANSAVVTALMEAGCFDGLPKTNQISLFNW